MGEYTGFNVRHDGVIDIRIRVEDDEGRVGYGSDQVRPGDVYDGIPYEQLRDAGAGRIVTRDGVASIQPFDTNPER
jgi:hypothetical protein